MLTCVFILYVANTVHQDIIALQEIVTLYVQELVIENENTTINASVSNPNPILGGSFLYYYKFKERTLGSYSWTTIACVQGNYTAGTEYRWEPNLPQARECVVELYSADKVFLSNDKAIVTMAGEYTSACTYL